MMPDWNTLHTLDWIILALLAWSVGWAAWRGFSREIFSILGLIAAFIITAHTGHLLDGPLHDLLPDHGVARIFSRAIIFLGCIIIINLIAIIGATALRALLSRPIDHSLGFLFGFLRGALIVLLPYLLVNLYIDPKIYPDWLTQSHAYPFLQDGAQALRKFIPPSQIHDDQRTDFGALKKAAQKKDELAEPAQEKKDKSKKDKDSAGNPSVKELIKAVKEAIGQ